MDIRHLRDFVEIARLLSFSKAALSLHLSQPSLSKVVRGLEDELDITLFDRSTRHLRLTDDGEVFLKFATQALSMVDDLKSSLGEGRALVRGELTIGLPPVIGASFFAGVIAGFRSRYPNIVMRTVEEGGKVIEQYVREAKIDAGVVVLPVDEEEFGTLPLMERHLSLIVPRNHPLAERKTVRLPELREEPFILFKEGFSLYDRVREACIREGFEPRIAHESAQWDMIGELVGAGLGVAFLPDSVVDKVDRKAVKVVPVTVPRIAWNLTVIWSKHRYLSHAARGWIDFMREPYGPNKPRN